MSFKAKDLQFDNSQPAFLRRLRGELTGGDTARHEQPVPRNKRLKQDDEDDAPTYVLEETKESLTKKEYEALVAGNDIKDKNNMSQHEVKEEAIETGPKYRDKIAELGATSKKRKVAKIIGNEEETSKESEIGEAKKSDGKSAKKPKKKQKAVKLTFGDDEA